MTSEDFIENLRRNGVKLIKNDGSLTEIPPDFLKRATELCNQLRCSSITYDIADPQDGEHTKLRVLDCGYSVTKLNQNLSFFQSKTGFINSHR